MYDVLLSVGEGLIVMTLIAVYLVSCIFCLDTVVILLRYS